MLRLENVETYYGNIQALKGISLEVSAGQIITLVVGILSALVPLIVLIVDSSSKDKN